MRNPILVAVAGTLLLASPALAGGCYTGRFSGGIVTSMRVTLGVDKFGALNGVMDVVVADRGRARVRGFGGRTFVQYLHCSTYDGVVKCSAECDSGIMTVLRMDDAVLEFGTRGLVVGNRTEACSTETLNLAGPDGDAVTFRLDRADKAMCNGL